MPKLQQVKIMFTPEAAHKINAACKGSSVTPLDAENQRVFDDVSEHGAADGYYTVELSSGKGFSYPNRNIERVRSSWQKIALHNADEVYGLDDGEPRGSDLCMSLDAEDEAYILSLDLDFEAANELRDEFASINAEFDI